MVKTQAEGNKMGSVVSSGVKNPACATEVSILISRPEERYCKKQGSQTTDVSSAAMNEADRKRIAVSFRRSPVSPKETMPK